MKRRLLRLLLPFCRSASFGAAAPSDCGDFTDHLGSFFISSSSGRVGLYLGGADTGMAQDVPDIGLALAQVGAPVWCRESTVLRMSWRPTGSMRPAMARYALLGCI